MSGLAQALPYISQAATLSIAAASVAFSRKSSREVQRREVSTKTWEKRTDTYTQILRELSDLDPTSLPTPEGFHERATAADVATEGVPLLPKDLDSDDWKDFRARVEAFSSEEVRYLFSLWLACLSGWTWLTMKCVIHFKSDRHKFELAKNELDASYESVYAARMELTEQIRAELNFGHRAVRKVTVASPEGFMGAVTEVEFQPGRQTDLRPISAARMVLLRANPGQAD
ncbi:hypothetical protein [Kitasatospora sp. NPDC094011]|uniref:hypothetical protein n=1 Tax=Kitasatospora sp. NPDC094011 TaxID=3364090 RepID=UPI003824DBD5